MKGKELFADRVVQLANGKNYKLEFSFQSLMELEFLKNGDFQAIFDMFDKDFNTQNMLYALWACLLTHHEKEFGEIPKSQIIDEMKKLVNAENFLLIKLATVESFAAFWNKAKNSRQLPEEYRKLFEEMERKGNQKK